MAYPRADQRHFDVRARRERPQQQVALEDEADELAAGTGGMRLPPDRASVDPDAPRVGLLRPPIRLSSVLLPDPERPVIATASPGSTRSETPRSAPIRPKLLLTPSTDTAAPAGWLIQ